MNHMNQKLPPKERARLLLKQMRIKEKAAQMIELALTGESEKWAERGIGSIINAYREDTARLQKINMEKSRLKIPILFAVDCIHGHALNPAATVFPSQLAMAQSFDREALRECARISGTEALTDGIPWVLSPVLCLGRDPRWGRIGETFGEDPFLSGELGAAMVEGYRDAGSLCCPKHYVAHGETVGGRDSYNVNVSDRKVKEYFDPPFKKAVDAGCATIMSAQHLHDSQPFCQNRTLINRQLKGEDGFEGFVITDNSTALAPYTYQTAATQAEAFYAAVCGGSDMLMFCAKNSDFYELAEQICAAHPAFEKRMDDAVLRILTVKFALGLFENPYPSADPQLLCCDAHYAAARKIAEKSIALLKNKNHLLPLKQVRRISVIGPAADNRYSQYGDWTYLNMPFSKNQHTDTTGRFCSYLSGIKAYAAKENITITYASGCDILDPAADHIAEAVAMAKDSDVIIAVVGDVNTQNGEHHDRCRLGLTGLQDSLLESLFALNKPVVVILSNGRPHCTPVIAEKADAVLQAFNSGIAGGEAMASILFGEVNPSGKLPVSIAKCEGQIPVCYDYTMGWHGDRYIDEKPEPLYPFGFGLSYTQFQYSDLRVPAEIERRLSDFTVSVVVENTGDTDGDEIVQLYIHQKQTCVLQPLKALKAFTRVHLQAGEKKTVVLCVRLRDLEIVDYDMQRKLQPGGMEIMVGKSSADADLLRAETTLV